MSKKTTLFILFVIAYSAPQNNDESLIRTYSSPGKIDALIENYSPNKQYSLVQLNLKSDSLVNHIMNIFPGAELNNGPASYQRIMNDDIFQELVQNIDSIFYEIISDDYNYPNNRLVWVDILNGNQTTGTWTDDDAISYDCSCLEGAENCVRLGWSEWYNPFDYWGEAWYAFSPPFYQEIEEVRVTIRGAQCDALPLSSETYMGMRNDSGGWSQNYQLSVDYTENIFVVPSNIWSNGFLMPQIGSEDNYVIDNVKLEFYYSCFGSENPPSNILASDATSCTNVDISWELSSSEASGQRLFRDNILIADLGPNSTTYQDWLAESNTIHTYCIEAYNECGSSERSCNPGSLYSAPSVINNTSASDGLFENQIVISWDENSNTENYKIYRDNVWLGLNNSNQTQYIDQFVDFGITYEYCIEAINICGASNWSCDTGYTNVQPGDVNEDGFKNILDIVAIVNLILLLENTTEYTLWAADLNADGSINVMDIILLVNQILD